ncbi:hypothetical protein BD413DRAFT_481628 [Trametes elegans]|nr:hypothetical protein BD413DRAFT_481628 [Trametes elegans]
MPPARSLCRRRRSSLAMGLTHVKPGNYGINPTPSPRTLTFAPNVTPGTYGEADDDSTLVGDSPQASNALFPPTAPATSAPTRRRLPPGKRLSQGYIPRPPNAFMLFRANFVRQKHVPGSIETAHGSLSRIIGNCWKALPLDEKKYWEVEAKKAKAAHKERYPHYRFRPVHNKNKKKAEAAAAPAVEDESSAKRKDKLPPLPAEEERCEAVAQLLLEGKKGEELAEAVRQLDMARAMSRPESVASDAFAMHPYAQQPPVPLYMQRRPSSVPPPSTLYHPAHPIALPSVPFFASPAPQMAFGAPNAIFNGYDMGTQSAHGSRAPSPVGNIARTRTLVGLRRASSCQPIPSERMWDGYVDMGAQQGFNAGPLGTASWQLQQDSEPLPEVTDASIFQPGWTSAFKDAPYAPPLDGPAYAPHAQTYSPHAHALSLNIGPLDSFAFAASSPSTATESTYVGLSPETSGMFDPHAPWPVTESGPPSTVSGSPTHSDTSLPSHSSQGAGAGAGICAPQPQHPQMQFESWAEHEAAQAHQLQLQQHQAVADVAQDVHFPPFAFGLDKGYDAEYDMYAGLDMGLGAGLEMTEADYGLCAPQEF